MNRCKAHVNKRGALLQTPLHTLPFPKQKPPKLLLYLRA